MPRPLLDIGLQEIADDKARADALQSREEDEANAGKMGKCRGCLKFYPTDKDRLCSRCAKLARQFGDGILFRTSTIDKAGSFIVGFSLRNEGLMPTRPSGIIVDWGEWEVVSRLVSQFYKAIKKGEIDKYNSHCSSRGRIPGERIPKTGFVYLLRSENGYYKIGRTKNIQSRLTAIQRKYPIDIKLIHFWECDDYIETEDALHRLYQDHRKGLTEWFSLPPEAVDEICAMP